MKDRNRGGGKDNMDKVYLVVRKIWKIRKGDLSGDKFTLEILEKSQGFYIIFTIFLDFFISFNIFFK